MAKKLLLMRHGETEIGIGYGGDMNRKLSGTGIDKLKRLNRVLQERNTQFDLILKGPAQRTMQTADFIASSLPVKEERMEASIYESTLQNLLELVNQLPDTCGNVLIIGHNPGISSLLAYLTDDFQLPLLPGMMAVITFDLPEWKMLSKGTGNLDEVLQ